MTAVMVVALRRRPDLSRERFLAHWRGPHAELVRALAGDLGILGYVQLHPGSRDETGWDGLALVSFRNRADLATHLTTAAGRSAARELRDDELKFMDVAGSLTWWGSDQRIL